MKKLYSISIKVLIFLLIIGSISWLVYKIPAQSWKQTLANVGLEQETYKCNR